MASLFIRVFGLENNGDSWFTASDSGSYISVKSIVHIDCITKEQDLDDVDDVDIPGLEALFSESKDPLYPTVESAYPLYILTTKFHETYLMYPDPAEQIKLFPPSPPPVDTLQQILLELQYHPDYGSKLPEIKAHFETQIKKRKI